MVGKNLLSDNIFKEYVKDYDGLIYVNENINGDFIYRCYYDYVEKCYCSCIECLDGLKNECKILFNKFNILVGELTILCDGDCVYFNKWRDGILYLLENGYDYDEDITAQTPILVEMELFTGDYIRKTVPASYIIKMLNYKGGENND